MATVLEECTTEKQRSAVRFLVAKGLNATNIIREIFPVFGGKCFFFLRKAVQNWMAKVSLMTTRLK
jgi:hypothetical protein